METLKCDKCGEDVSIPSTILINGIYENITDETVILIVSCEEIPTGRKHTYIVVKK